MSRVKQIVGLDLGERNARAVWVELHDGKPRVTRAEKLELPLEGADANTLVGAWLAQLGLRKGFVSAAIPGTKLVFQPGRLTPDDPRTPRQVADMELVRFSDMVGEAMKCGVASCEHKDSSRHYLMAMARPSVISETLSDLDHVDVRPADLVPAPVALFAGFAMAEGFGEGVTLIADIGATKTEIAIGDRHGILFARSFPMGGRHFTDAIAKGSACPIQQADSFKLREATLRDGGPFAEFLRPLAERWYAQFSAVIAAYGSSVRGSGLEVDNVVLSGGGARLDGFCEWLGSRMASAAKTVASKLSVSSSSTDVRVLNAKDMPSPPGIADLGTYATALGLALVSLEVPFAPRLSLIPDSLRDEVVFREKKPYWIAAGVTVVLALVAFTASLLVTLGRESARMEAERVELKRREQIDKSIAAVRKQTEMLRQEAEPLRKLLAGGPASRYVMSLVASSIAPEDWVSLVSDEETYLRTEAPKQAAQPSKQLFPGFFIPGFRDNDTKAKEPSGVFSPAQAKPAPEKARFTAFIIEGYTPDVGYESVDAMMRRMRSGERVVKVDLLSDDKVKPPVELPEAIRRLNIPEMRRFVIRLEVTEP